MGNYSKLIGSLVGGGLGFGVSNFGLPAELATPDVVGAITLILATLFTYVFPKNQ